MKSEIISNKTKAEKPFPKLMQCKEDGIVVMFAESGKGMVVIGNSRSPVGEYSDSCEMEYFFDFEGTIELSNGD